jgi:hypothetical protein
MADRGQDLARAREECTALEREAGIEAKLERAREGRLIPLGALGEKVTSKEYFADHNMTISAKERPHFSVEAPDMRTKLIAAQRKAERLYRQLLEEDLASANRSVFAARAKIEQQPWGKAALVSVCCVAAGYWPFGMVGAIGGALAGYFFRQSVIAEARRVANEELREATSQVERVQEDIREDDIRPEFFSLDDEVSGDRDSDLDTKSAYANLFSRQTA